MCLSIVENRYTSVKDARIRQGRQLRNIVVHNFVNKIPGHVSTSAWSSQNSEDVVHLQNGGRRIVIRHCILHCLMSLHRCKMKTKALRYVFFEPPQERGGARPRKYLHLLEVHRKQQNTFLSLIRHRSSPFCVDDAKRSSSSQGCRSHLTAYDMFWRKR